MRLTAVRSLGRVKHQESLLCRFLDAGITSGASCSGGRRPKSARARSRGKFGRRAGGRRYGDLIVAPVMMVGAKLARGDLDSVGSGAWKRAMRISVVAWSISTGDRFVDWRGWAERDRRQRGASATEREMGFAAFDRGGQPSSAGELIPEFSHGVHPNSPPQSFRSAVQEILDRFRGSERKLL